jgi:hypothetical protein
MPIRYNSSGDIRPTPLVTINRQQQKDAGGRTLSNLYTFTLTGTIVPSGVLYGTGVESDLMAQIITEQDRLRQLFSVDGKRLEITPWEGKEPVVDTYCDVQSITFDQGIWVNRCDYNVTLTSTMILRDEESVGVDEKFEYEEYPVADVGEDWSFTDVLPSGITITHTVRAKGLKHYDSDGNAVPPETSAREWCRKHMISTNDAGVLTSGSPAVSGIVALTTNRVPTLGSFLVGQNESCFFNITATENFNQIDSTFTLTETMTYVHSSVSANRANHTWEASVDESSSEKFLNINIRGRIVGYASDGKNFDTRNTKAKDYWKNVLRSDIVDLIEDKILDGYESIDESAAYVLASSPVSLSFTYLLDGGEIVYAGVYRAYKPGLVDGAIEESIEVQDTPTTDVFAEIPVPGRAGGPVVQDMATVTPMQRTIAINLLMDIDRTADSYPTSVSELSTQVNDKPNVNDIIEELKPEGSLSIGGETVTVEDVYKNRDGETWNPFTGRYTRNVTFRFNATA